MIWLQVNDFSYIAVNIFPFCQNYDKMLVLIGTGEKIYKKTHCELGEK